MIVHPGSGGWGERGWGVREEPSCPRELGGALQGRVHQSLILFTRASGSFFLSFFSFFSSSTFYLSRQTETSGSHRLRDASLVTEEESPAGQGL